MPKIRYGMIGGGDGAFIGVVHRHAAQLDNQFEMVCGAFSASAEKSLQAGTTLGLTADRCYPDYQTLCKSEAALPADKRMQCVVIVTPNHLHFGPAVTALNHGFHILSDKPATFSLAECRQLAHLLAQTSLLYGLTHTYTGYPMVQEARSRIARGELGTVRKILVEYTQGWLAESEVASHNPQAAWRLDPARAGASCCMGDIGVHAFNLLEYISGLQATRLCAELNSIVPSRRLDDDGTVLMHFNNGARGTLVASQICVGDENNLRVRVYGDKAAIDWQQMQPNTLWLRSNDSPALQIRTATASTSAVSKAHTRLPAGHPEGYLEAFANLYRNFAANLRAHAKGQPLPFAVTGIQDALRGMLFIDTAVRSSQEGVIWQSLE